MDLQKIACTNCGAVLDWTGSFQDPVKCTYCGTVFVPQATVMPDVWLMTDRVARARYEYKGKLDDLAHDIRFEVMRGLPWSDLDRAYAAEVARLEAASTVRKLASFWSISPYPSIYRTMRAGEIVLKDHHIPFQEGQDMVWACPMTRDRFDLNLPVLIGDFQDQRTQRLCGEMANAMMGRMP